MALGRCALVFEVSRSDVICALVGMTRYLMGTVIAVATSTSRQYGWKICPGGCCL